MVKESWRGLIGHVMRLAVENEDILVFVFRCSDIGVILFRIDKSIG